MMKYFDHQPQAAHHQENNMNAMFKELNDSYRGYNERRHDMHGNNNYNVQQQQRVDVIEADELFL